MTDAYANFAISTVVAAPSPANTGTALTVQSSHGGRFPTPPFNATVWLAGTAPDPLSAEIVRVTARSGDVLTIARAQESTSPRFIAPGDVIAATITAKTLTDLLTAGPPAGSVTQTSLSTALAATLPLTTPAVSTASSGALAAGATHRIDCAGGNKGRTLQAAAAAGPGAVIVVKKFDATGNSLFLSPTGSDTINSTVGYTRALTLPYEAVHLRSDGVSDWTVVASDTPVAQLDVRYSPPAGSDNWLKAWAANLDALIRSTSITRDSNSAAIGASVIWPDGTTGVYAGTPSTTATGAIDSYTVTYAPSGGTMRTVTQPAMTRDATTGAVTNRPAMTVA